IKQSKGAKGLPITRIETLSGGVFNRDRLGYADVYDEKKYEKYILDNNDILMSHINSKAYIGRSVVYKKNKGEIIIHGMNLLRLKPIDSRLDSVYAKFFFDTFFFKKQVASIRKDAVNQSSIAVGDIVKLIMLLPPLDLQQTFATKIESIEQQKDTIVKSIAETQKLFDYTMDKYFG
ncbi:MAG: restriction endonuclease subunit S, partial [Clostridia bacterium]|nr:restriction endonuclease subunit S [Clostridia bacterium]